MALTDLQRRVCRVLADRRIAGGESYVAGGLALNAAIGGARVSRDIDLFHDTDEALSVSYSADVSALERAGFAPAPVRTTVGFIEAVLREEGEALEIQWVRDSAYRFFPLVTHPDLGLTLDPFDLATNKVLALVGRVAVRDWVDIIACHERVTSLGCLAWAATGKDPGLGPLLIVDEAARTARYSAPEFDSLAFEGEPPSREALGMTWRAALADARASLEILPPAEIGRAVLDADGTPFRGDASLLAAALAAGAIAFHQGAIGGVLPAVRPKLV